MGRELFQDDPDGAVIGAVNILVDRSRLDAVEEGVGDSEVIESPAHITFPGLCPKGPPGIGVRGFRVEVPEGVGEAGGQGLTEALTFFIGKTG